MIKSTGKNFNIIFIGAGRVATQMAKTLHSCGHNIVCIYSRTTLSAKVLANKVDALCTNNIDDIISMQADLWIYAIKDDVIRSIAEQIPNNNAIHIHTSGSVDIEVFAGIRSNYASIYPLQTFNIDRDVDFRKIPIFYEANNVDNATIVKLLCKQISDEVCELSSNKRKKLHIAAVFACNFTNSLWVAAEKILEKENIPKHIIYPLVTETLSKAQAIGAKNAQTGPAVRKDNRIINEHISMLDNQYLLKEIYSNISNLIVNQSDDIEES